jgi:hypothetical protein
LDIEHIKSEEFLDDNRCNGERFRHRAGIPPSIFQFAVRLPPQFATVRIYLSDNVCSVLGGSRAHKKRWQ